jgi:hypothetical protein
MNYFVLIILFLHKKFDIDKNVYVFLLESDKHIF